MNPLLKVIPLYKNEAKLIQKAINQNRDAQRILYDTYSPKMLSVCRYYIRDIMEAEEVMLNGFYKVFSNLGSFRHEGSFEGWIRRIMTREALSFLRSKRQPVFNQEDENFADAVENHVISELAVEDIQQLIYELPDGYRLVFVMYAIEGYKHYEIAKMLEISKGTSKSQLHKARRILQEQIKKLNIAGYGTT